MIESVTFKNFKSLRDTTLHLGRLTALVGANGCGKSTALLGVRLVMGSIGKFDDDLHKLVEECLYPAPLEGLCTAGASPASEWSLELYIGDTYWMVGYNKENLDQPFTSLGLDLDSKSELHVLSLRLDPSILASPSPATTHEPTMDDRGAGLATLLHHLAASRDERLDYIEADMRELVPTFKRVYTSSAPVRVDKANVAGFTLDIGFEGIGRVPASHVSEGTLLALGLLTSLHMEGADLVLIDDADRALHPVAQYRLVEILYKVLERRPELQIVLTTHSLDLVNACKGENVRVMGPTPEGTLIRKLTEHPDAAELLETWRSGEVWATVGEDWVGDPEGGSGDKEGGYASAAGR